MPHTCTRHMLLTYTVNYMLETIIVLYTREKLPVSVCTHTLFTKYTTNYTTQCTLYMYCFLATSRLDILVSDKYNTFTIFIKIIQSTIKAFSVIMNINIYMCMY